MDRFDVCIIGAGVVGLAIAAQLARSNCMRNRSIVVLERESSFGQHTSSRNSEVIHAGIYYDTGSLKAELCVRGKHLLYEHCERHLIPFKRIGKYIVGHADQEEILQQLLVNAAANGVDDLCWLDSSQLKYEEPAIKAGCALLSPSTGIVDSHCLMQSLLHLAQNNGVEFAPFSEVTGIDYDNHVYTITSSIKSRASKETYRFQSSVIINSAGLDATVIAAVIAADLPPPIPALHLCKGDYFAYSATSPLRHLVYPVPEKNAAGLGIHATLDLSGQLRFGPDTEFIDRVRYDIDPGKGDVFAKAISDYFPGILAEKLLPAYAGIRPKLAPADSPAQDFIIQSGINYSMPGLIQLFGIESPGLTSSLAIGEYVGEMVKDLNL